MQVELKFNGDIKVSTEWEDSSVTVSGDLCSESIDAELEARIKEARAALEEALRENTVLEAEILKLKDLILDILAVNRELEGVKFK